MRDQGAADPGWRLHACLESLRRLGVGALVTIGGDDTAFSGVPAGRGGRGALRVAHVPKTIDIDLPLPGGVPTFGFETAGPGTGRVRIRHVNTESSSYRVAREYMIRLDHADLQDSDKLGPIAAAAGLTPEACRDRYGYLADG